MKKTVLSVAAHGDDVEFMAGGTLAQMAADGHDVYLAIATHNDRGSLRLSSQELRAVAQAEAQAAATALGARGVFMLGYVGGDLCDVRPGELRERVMRLIRQVRADVIFSWDPHAPFENHPDHRAIAWAVSDAASLAQLPLFYPEHAQEGLLPQRVREWYWYSKDGWQADKLVDISATMGKKLEALYAYESQMVLTLDEFLDQARAAGVDPAPLAHIDPTDYKPWIEIAMRDINGKLGQKLGVDYAEAFRYERVEVPGLFQT
jgi:LmbE family N-acetylglucosaminyl deacetylase